MDMQHSHALRLAKEKWRVAKEVSMREGNPFMDRDTSENINTGVGWMDPSLVPSAFSRNHDPSIVAESMFSRQCSFRV